MTPRDGPTPVARGGAARILASRALKDTSSFTGTSSRRVAVQVRTATLVVIFPLDWTYLVDVGRLIADSDGRKYSPPCPATGTATPCTRPAVANTTAAGTGTASSCPTQPSPTIRGTKCSTSTCGRPPRAS
ncbi:unnamed protein product [Menidia menidia]|uniref:(Atlantic silverside) hypothetical protein n=1 Tax=Menidia menidia TaxID=238744 RepID=A0A8S4B203_9TELE|nr:unnamed protein product [Menidia menidia]